MTHDELRENLETCLGMLPGMLLLIDLDGRILKATKTAEEFLNCPVSKDSTTKFEDLLSGGQRTFSDILALVRQFNTEYRKEHTLVIMVNGNSVLHHAELEARRVTDDDGTDVRFLLFSITSLQTTQRLTQELEKTRLALDHSTINVGVHVVDIETNSNSNSPESGPTFPIVWKNRWSGEQFAWDEKAPRATDLVSEKQRKNTIDRLTKKFQGTAFPTSGQSREFLLAQGERERAEHGEIEGVYTIEDHFIYDVPPELKAKPTRILTTVVPLNFPAPILNLLRVKGINDPWLEQQGISTFQKTVEDNAFHIEKTNRTFRKEFENDEASHKRIDEFLRTKDINPKPSFEEKWSQAMNAGITDDYLYTADEARKYIEDDNYVRLTKDEKQGLEKHERIGEVQFLKLPVKDDKNRVIAIQGYFWKASRTASIINKLTELLHEEKSRVLESLPDLFHVLRKDKDLHVTFCNDQHARSHNMKVSDILGKTDRELFHDRGIAYEKDDRMVLDQQRTIVRLEKHTFPDRSDQTVCVVKSPWKEHGEVKGIQCIYWAPSAINDMIKESKAAATGEKFREDKRHIFISVAGEHQKLGKALSEQMKQLNPYMYTDNISKGDFESHVQQAIEESLIYVLLLSPKLFEKKFIIEKELPLIYDEISSYPHKLCIPIPVDAFAKAGVPRKFSWICEQEWLEIQVGRKKHDHIPRGTRQSEYFRAVGDHLQQKLRDVLRRDGA